MFLRKLIFFLLFSFTINLLIGQTTLSFAGIDWFVRNGSGGPGPNNWSDAADQVWVDGNGDLHLSIRKIGTNWYCSEIYTQQSMGYGNYKFYVASALEDFDPQIVAGLFTYENDENEIDIEFSKWGNDANPSGWYTVQPPPNSSENQQYFNLNLSGDYSTHLFDWNNTSIFFQSYHGHYPSLPSSEYLIHEWNYSGNHIPIAGNERLHLNFWLFQGQAPNNNQNAELVIKSVSFPSSLPSNSFETSINITTYPNPVEDVVHIAISDAKNKTICEIFNSLGQSVYRGFFENTILLSTINWTSGIYTLKVENQNRIYYHLIIKE